MSSLEHGAHIKAKLDGRVASLLKSMDAAGIERSVICSIATKPEQFAPIMKWSQEIASERIIPLASIHPDTPDPEAEVERIARAGLRGLKFHPHYMECPLDDPRTVRIARAAERAGLAMMLHTGYDLAFEKDDIASPERVRRLHEAAPGLRLCAAHLGGWERWEEVRRTLVGLPIYLETSYTFGRCPEDLLVDILLSHPPDHLLFGTDGPWTDPVREIARLRALPLPADLKRRMLWDNALVYAGFPK
jgi:uncharacterized protein